MMLLSVLCSIASAVERRVLSTEELLDRHPEVSAGGFDVARVGHGVFWVGEGLGVAGVTLVLLGAEHDSRTLGMVGVGTFFAGGVGLLAGPALMAGGSLSGADSLTDAGVPVSKVKGRIALYMYGASWGLVAASTGVAFATRDVERPELTFLSIAATGGFAGSYLLARGQMCTNRWALEARDGQKPSRMFLCPQIQPILMPGVVGAVATTTW